ncbi:ECF transporter S component [Clostridium chromiireducens]|uniref:ECF transporter S component n=1 Tax=Clostridium chromiireducens TaxID=225345 RepID=A0A964W014_9CLOT|nr:ECF transporter S component [Clostridium chromiireducens]MVX62151.1 ECF transporter S component [Clostridium chromiireducens]
MNNKIKQMVYAGLLTALAILIPIQFGFLRIMIPPFSATLASHVPMMLSMLISPFVAVVVGIGSTIGFLIAGMPAPIVARAATHIVVGYVGAYLIMKNQSYTKAVAITAPIHGILEALVVIPFVGLNLFTLIVVTGIGTIVHHAVDSVIAYGIIRSVARASKKSIYNVFGDFKTKQQYSYMK